MRTGRLRAEAVLALQYALVFPVALIVGLFAQIIVFDATWSPTLPYELVLLLDALPVALAGALLIIHVRLSAQERPDVRNARWFLRLAPLLVVATLLTGLAAWQVIVEGQVFVRGLVVLPALAAWSGIAGELATHAWLARGREGRVVFVRLLFSGMAGLVLLMITALVLRSPAGELSLARSKCQASYARDRTAADSALTSLWTPQVGREMGTRSCAELTSGAADH